MEYIESYLPYLMTSQRAEGEEYTYGQYLEKQIPEVIRMYKEQGSNTNQAYMTVGDGNSIFLADPPCLRGIDTRIRDNKLHFVVYFRSWDLWAGFPSNLAGIQLLKEYMSSEIGVEDGEIVAISKGLHVYEYAWDLAKTTLRIG
jgi:thymidylate synthase